MSDAPLSALRPLVEACVVDPSRVATLSGLDDQDRQRIREAVATLDATGEIDFGDGTVLMYDTFLSGGVLSTSDAQELAE